MQAPVIADLPAADEARDVRTLREGRLEFRLEDRRFRRARRERRVFRRAETIADMAAEIDAAPFMRLGFRPAEERPGISSAGRIVRPAKAVARLQEKAIALRK